MDSKAAGEQDDPLLVAGEEDDPLLVALHELNDSLEHTKKTLNSPALNYLRDVRAMAATAADVKELLDAYLFIVDMPGVGYSDIKVDVQLEDDCELVISGERWREEDELEEKYEMMERWMGKLMQKFKLPENANTDAVSALCKDGVLTVTVEKLPAPVPKKVKSIQVKTA